MHKLFIFIGLLLSISLAAFSQTEHPKDYFRSPLDIPILLSGNFGELRGNHFHSGIDMKTGGTEGKNVYAVADGYVSRIKVSPFGYGKALYITHPNGYTSVYAHLQSYKGDIGKLVKDSQYEKESFEIELFPEAAQLPVKKGDLIALSGNSGGSGGPHLHFEIRKTGSEKPQNALFFGLDVKDNTPPAIKAISVYPLEDFSHVNHTTGPLYLKTQGGNGKYRLTNPMIACSGLIGVGIETYDQLDGAPNKNGVYSVELLADSQRIYYHQIDEFAFDESRYINSHIDYKGKLSKSRTVQKSFVQPANRLPIYDGVKNYGMITVIPDTMINLEYIVKDAYGNTSSIAFQLEGKKSINPLAVDTTQRYEKKMPQHKSNFFINDAVEVRFPEYCFYAPLEFEFEELPAREGTLCPVYRIHDIYTPVHKYYSLAISLDSIPQGLENKLLIVSYSQNGKAIAEGGTLRGKQISTKTRSFGEYTVMLDTTPPVIKPLTISEGRDLSGMRTIRVKISDNLSGIKTYRGTINDKWVLMDYDAKRGMLVHAFDAHSAKGKGLKFELIVTDERGNVAEYSAGFSR